MLDGVYRTTEGGPVFHAVCAPTPAELQALLTRIIKRLMRLLTRKGYLIEEHGMTTLHAEVRLGINRSRNYTPKERGPLDALSDRYLPAFESALKFFRTYERLGG